jgi:hypothetical protein
MFEADAGAAMAAGIVQSVDAAVVAAHQHYGIGADLHSEVVARAWDFAVMADEQPVPVPDVLEVEPMVCRIDVERLVETVAGFAVAQPRQHFVVYVHVRPRKAKD